MSYNLKNNNIVIIAVAIAAIMTISPAAYAQTADNQINTEAPAPQVQENDDLFGLDEPNDNTQAETNSEAAPSTAVDETGKAETEAAEEAQARGFRLCFAFRLVSRFCFRSFRLVRQFDFRCFFSFLHFCVQRCLKLTKIDGRPCLLCQLQIRDDNGCIHGRRLKSRPSRSVSAYPMRRST